MQIRVATSTDSESLLKIYDYYVRNTAITFEIETPSNEEFQKRIINTLVKYPYLVLEDDHQLIGYAYAGAFHPRAAYEHCAEVSIYLDCQARGKGYGKLLYGEIEKILVLQGIYNLYACIAHTKDNQDPYLTNKSEIFHRSLGYREVGLFSSCGYKFNRWYDMIWMEKIVGVHGDKVQALLAFQDIWKKVKL